MKTKALFKQVVKLEQIDPLWSISGEKTVHFKSNTSLEFPVNLPRVFGESSAAEITF